MERISWIQNGSTYKRVEGSIDNVDAPPVGVYNIGLSMTGWFLEYTSEKFTFNYKVYGLQSEFVKHVLTAYNSTKGNFGVLLNGTRGTGKTVTAKVLANKFNLPVIIVKSFGDSNKDLIEYLASFNFDCIFFFDEFEKNFNSQDSSILQIMDGVYTSTYRRIFLLTTNETNINENLICRPSRLRYIHEFGNLEQSVVSEYLDDTLNDKSCKEGLMNFVDTLEISTIDILKSIVDEVNIFGFDTFMQTKKFFNIKTASYTYHTVCTCLNRNESLKDYTEEDFLADVKKTKEHPAPARYQYEESSLFDEAMEEYKKNWRPKKGNSFTLISGCEKSVKSLKPGDIFGYYDTERVAFIDLEKKVVATYDRDDEYYKYYYIENVDSKPSLYKDALTNPYYVL